MADAVTATILQQGQDKLTLSLTNRSDATGEAAVVKLNLATIFNQFNVAANKCGILEAQWSIGGFTSVALLWDHATDDTALIMAAGNGYRDFRDTNIKMDPQVPGGNLLLTTFGAAAGATYDILLLLGIRFPAN